MREHLETASRSAAEAVGKMSYMLIKGKATKRDILEVMKKIDDAKLALQKACRGGDGR